MFLTILHHPAPSIPTIRTLATFNISANRLCAPGTKALAEVLEGNQTITELNISNNGMGWDDWYKEGSDMSGVQALANAIPTMGALVKFDISSNELRAEGGKNLAGALKDNKIMKELNISNNDITRNSTSYIREDMPGVIAIGDAIPTMGELVKFTISGERYYDNGIKDAPPVTIEASMIEADFSGKYLGALGAILIAAFLPMCKYVQEYIPLSDRPTPDIFSAIRAMTSLNVSNNNLTYYGKVMSGVEALAAAIPECK